MMFRSVRRNVPRWFWVILTMMSRFFVMGWVRSTPSSTLRPPTTTTTFTNTRRRPAAFFVGVTPLSSSNRIPSTHLPTRNAVGGRSGGGGGQGRGFRGQPPLISPSQSSTMIFQSFFEDNHKENEKSGNSDRDANDDKDDNTVKVGSKEYLEGFLSSPIQDDSVAKRGNGLEQALKLGGSVAAGLVVLLLVFMASNGLL